MAQSTLEIPTAGGPEPLQHMVRSRLLPSKGSETAGHAWHSDLFLGQWHDGCSPYYTKLTSGTWRRCQGIQEAMPWSGQVTLGVQDSTGLVASSRLKFGRQQHTSKPRVALHVIC